MDAFPFREDTGPPDVAPGVPGSVSCPPRRGPDGLPKAAGLPGADGLPEADVVPGVIEVVGRPPETGGFAGHPLAVVDSSGHRPALKDSDTSPSVVAGFAGRPSGAMSSDDAPSRIVGSDDPPPEVAGSDGPPSGAVNPKGRLSASVCRPGHRPSGEDSPGHPPSGWVATDGHSPPRAGRTADRTPFTAGEADRAEIAGEVDPQARASVARVSSGSRWTAPGGAARRNGRNRLTQMSQTAAGRCGAGICGPPARAAERMVTVANFVITHGLLGSMKDRGPRMRGRR
ncbi:hypothetical protein GCM10017559_09740 [Streptosporangium longisporum]|uniref:Uncharacterized protein n=1 Tax=Streptosporangium longisporum TaxID=46187 RepID=A0ABN3XSE3_9ACTN